MSSIKYEAKNPLSEALSIPKKTGLLEFAAYMIIFIVVGKVYVPDYALFYADCNTDFSAYYEGAEQIEGMKL